VRKKNIGKKPAGATICVASAAATPLTRRIDSGTSGLATRSSLATKATRITAATASSAIVRVAPQPTSGAFTRA
jgi:hypothetical protein